MSTPRRSRSNSTGSTGNRRSSSSGRMPSLDNAKPRIDANMYNYKPQGGNVKIQSQKYARVGWEPMPMPLSRH